MSIFAFRRVGGRALATVVASSALVLIAMGGVSQATGVTVTDLNNGATPLSMAEALVGSGVAISNVKYTGNNRAAGSFTSGATSIGFENGIVLDSGRVQTYSTDPPCSKGVEGPNTCYEATEGKPEGPSGPENSTGFGEPGDSNLEELSGFPSYDAAVLEFDFVPKHSTLQVSYVFGSEEYSDYANTQFNDVFAFYVDGSNCALVPGTSEPVTINTINNGNDVGGDPTAHHPEYFRDNVRPAPTIQSQMDGLTTVLTCNATVTANETNHMKLAISDSSDNIFDTAVFLESESLISGTGVSTTLSGEGKSGPAVTVKEGSAVTDEATLSGENASKATGTVTYKVYSDSECKNLLTEAGTVTVTAGSVPPSNPETFGKGTYYWQASYSGDASNDPGKSICGAEVETVEAKPEECGAGASAKGVGHAGPIGSGGLNENDKLICPPGAGTETFETTFPNGDHWHLSHLTGAKCEAITEGHVFGGQGTGTLNKKSGYSATFSWEVVGKKIYFSLTIEKESIVVDSVSHLLLNKNSKETVSC